MNRLALITLITLTSCITIIAENVNAHRSLVDEHTSTANKCQKACIIEIQAVIDITPLVLAESNGKKYVTGHVISTVGNKVGIDEGDTCAVFELPQADGSSKTCVICTSGKCFENISGQEGSATGTPGFLMYNNYIGTYFHPKAASGLLGADRRTVYCLGECK